MKRKLTAQFVRWPPQTRLDFLGRNGYGHCTGLQVSTFDDIVELQPITSRDRLARCHIDLPMAAIPRLVEMLANCEGTKGAAVGVTASHGRTDLQQELIGHPVFARGGRQRGRITGTSACPLESCGGVRLHVRWANGKRTYPCSKGCKERRDGHLQIA